MATVTHEEPIMRLVCPVCKLQKAVIAGRPDTPWLAESEQHRIWPQWLDLDLANAAREVHKEHSRGE